MSQQGYTDTPFFYKLFQDDDPDYQPVARSPEADQIGSVELVEELTANFFSVAALGAIAL